MNLRRWRTVTFALWILGIGLLILSAVLSRKTLTLPAVLLMLAALLLVNRYWHCPHCGHQCGQFSLKRTPNCTFCGKPL